MDNYESTIIHITDPHFGTEKKEIADQLINEINGIEPDVVIVSGDITQRARRVQFEEAKKFLDGIKSPKVIIPGNHDLPFFNFVMRFVDPYKYYKKYISEDIYPEFSSGKMSIVGVNTCSPFRSQTGRIKEEDIDYLKKYFSELPAENIKGVVIHHNIFPFEGMKRNTSLVNADKFLTEMNKCGVDLVFAGHLHKSLVHTYSEAGVENNLIVLQAGTCVSRRLRREDNTYLIVKLNRHEIKVEFRVYNGRQFEFTNDRKFRRSSQTACN